MSLVKDDSSAEKFAIDFFSKVEETLAKKTGGKKRKIKRSKTSKSFKKQKAGVRDFSSAFNRYYNIVPILPFPVDDQNTLDVEQVRLQSASGNLTINVVPSTQDPSQDININAKISQLLDSARTKIDLTPQELKLTQQELIAFALHVSLQTLNPEINAAASITNQSLNNITKMTTQTDIKSEESERKVSDILRNVSKSSNLIESQVLVLREVTQNATQDIETVSQLYQSGATPEAISSASISAFINQFGYLSMIFNLIACYKNRLNEFGTNLKTKHPVIFFIMSALYSVASFIIFSLFKLFKLLLNTKVGKLFLIYQFIILYKNNNVFAVFIANALLNLLKIVDRNLGISSYVMSCIEEIKQSLIDYLPKLLTSASIAGILNSAITSALSSPTVLSQFINSLAPEISSQILRSALPAISNELSQVLTNAAPEIAQQIANGVTTSLSGTLSGAITGAITEGTAHLASGLAAELAPALIEGLTEGLTTGVSEVITRAVPALIENAVVESGRQLIQHQTQSALTASFSSLALKLGVQTVGSYFGVPVTGLNLLTNSGGSNKKTKSKKYKKRRTSLKA
jgi:hypothetical protein